MSEGSPRPCSRYRAPRWLEPFWMMAQALDFSIGFHEGSTTAMPTVGVDGFEDDRGARHMIVYTMERLRIALLESGGRLIAPWLDRMALSALGRPHSPPRRSTRGSPAAPAASTECADPGPSL